MRAVKFGALHTAASLPSAPRRYGSVALGAAWTPDGQYLIARKEDGKPAGIPPVELWIYPNEYHEKILPTHRLAVYDRNVDWNEFWLMSKEDPDPAKAKQYERWRALRALDEADRKKGTTP